MSRTIIFQTYFENGVKLKMVFFKMTSWGFFFSNISVSCESEMKLKICAIFFFVTNVMGFSIIKIRFRELKINANRKIGL